MGRVIMVVAIFFISMITFALYCCLVVAAREDRLMEKREALIMEKRKDKITDK